MRIKRMTQGILRLFQVNIINIIRQIILLSADYKKQKPQANDLESRQCSEQKIVTLKNIINISRINSDNFYLQLFKFKYITKILYEKLISYLSQFFSIIIIFLKQIISQFTQKIIMKNKLYQKIQSSKTDLKTMANSQSNIILQNQQKNIKKSLDPKQAKFTEYFQNINHKGNQSLNNQKVKQFKYENLFEKYSNKDSLINKIRQSFDNGDIFSKLNQSYQLCQSEVYKDLNESIKNNVSQIKNLFQIPIHKNKPIIKEPFLINNYSLALLTFRQPFLQHESDAINIVYNEFSSLNQEEDENNIFKDTKIYLLLNQILSQKKRKQQTMYYYNAMQIKLQEYINYITQDEFINYSLPQKIKLIVLKLNDYRSKTIDRCSILGLIEIFFNEYRDLQKEKLIKLKTNKMESTEKNLSLKSDTPLKSIKISHEQKKINTITRQNSKRSKMSEPTAKKKRIQLQSQWITEQI